MEETYSTGSGMWAEDLMEPEVEANPIQRQSSGRYSVSSHGRAEASKEVRVADEDQPTASTKPLWAKGMISNRPMQSTRTAARGASTPTFERIGGIEFIACPGLVVVPVEASSQFNAAIAVVRTRRSSPRVKGVLLIPKDSKISAGAQAIKGLALEGIVIVNSELDSIRDGAVAHATRFVEEREEDLAVMTSFMSGV